MYLTYLIMHLSQLRTYTCSIEDWTPLLSACLGVSTSIGFLASTKLNSARQYLLHCAQTSWCCVIFQQSFQNSMGRYFPVPRVQEQSSLLKWKTLVICLFREQCFYEQFISTSTSSKTSSISRTSSLFVQLISSASLCWLSWPAAPLTKGKQ